MRTHDTPIEGLKVIELNCYKDDRGYFVERYNQAKFAELGFDISFKQDNMSRSKPKVIRGLHAQHSPSQGKLVGVIRGKIWDVAVDIRQDSKTYGQHFGIELSDENNLLLWIPAGFAHGFCVLGDIEADVLYKVDNLYSPKTEFGIIWNDPEININWPVKDPIVSDKDKALPTFSSYQLEPVY